MLRRPALRCLPRSSLSGLIVRGHNQSTLPHANQAPSTEPPSTTARAIMTEYTKPSFYGRDLPDFLVDFRAEEGRKRLVRTLGNGTAVPFLSLASTFHTQSEPAYCGLATLAIVLNALQVDPQRVWKTPWRWYAEELLECCAPLVAVKQKGITFVDFACLARCNGCECETTFAEQGNAAEYELLKQAVVDVCTGTPHGAGARTWAAARAEAASRSSSATQTAGSPGLGATGSSSHDTRHHHHSTLAAAPSPLSPVSSPFQPHSHSSALPHSAVTADPCSSPHSSSSTPGVSSSSASCPPLPASPTSVPFNGHSQSTTLPSQSSHAANLSTTTATATTTAGQPHPSSSSTHHHLHDDHHRQPTYLPNQHLVVSFARKALQQTGSGHFSPVAAWDPESESVLIMDTARFKYPPYWAPLSRIYQAMLPVDPDSSRPRGWAVLSPTPRSMDTRTCCMQLGNNAMARAAPRRHAHDPPPD